MKNIMRFIMAPLFVIILGFASVPAIAGGGEGGREAGDEMPWGSGAGAGTNNERVNCEELCFFPFPDPLSPAHPASPSNDAVNAEK